MENLIVRVINYMINMIDSDIKDLNKDNIDLVTKKLANLQRLLYKLNK